MIEQDIAALVSPYVAQVFWVMTDDDFAFDYTSGTPIAILQHVGGETDTRVENVMPDTRNMRLQVSVWGANLLNVVIAIRAIEQSFLESTMVVKVIGAFSSEYQDDLKIFGARQDFGVWYA